MNGWLRRKGLETILWGSLFVGGLTGCGDDMGLWGRTVIGNKTYTFSEDLKKANELEVVPLDSTSGIYYFDGDNDHRILSPFYDYVDLFYPKEPWKGERIEGSNPRLYDFDSLYVHDKTTLQDTLDARKLLEVSNSPQDF
ncbi:MAG: hypothetical protein ACP5N3_03030 [Candidatus Nanoarchaeia archaeon]